MQYLMLIYSEESYLKQQDDSFEDRLLENYLSVIETLQSEGVYLGGDRLRPTDTATSVKVREQKILVTDGPFAETKEQLGGYFMVDCKDLDHATEVAAKIPSAQFGTIEIRPIWNRPESET